jgi:hypothetical protein
MKIVSVYRTHDFNDNREVACLEVCGLTVGNRTPYPKEKRETRFRRGKLPAEVVNEIERLMANGIEDGITQDTKYNFHPSPADEHASKSGLIERIILAIEPRTFEAKQVEMMYEMELAELDQLWDDLNGLVGDDAKKHSLSVIYPSRDKREADEQTKSLAECGPAAMTM